MSNTKELHNRFLKAFDAANTMDDILIPIDLRLQFYAYYKQANFGNNFSFNSGINVRSGFKFNAWMQLKGMSADEAKREYIKLANKF